MKSLRADLFIDRIDGDVVTVTIADGGETFEIPRALLPLNVSEGWVVRWQVERAEQIEAQSSSEIHAQLEALLDGDHLDED